MGLPMTMTVREANGPRVEHGSIVPEMPLRLKPEFEEALCLPEASPAAFHVALWLLCKHGPQIPLPVQLYIHHWRTGRQFVSTVIDVPDDRLICCTLDGDPADPGFSQPCGR